MKTPSTAAAPQQPASSPFAIRLGLSGSDTVSVPSPEPDENAHWKEETSNWSPLRGPSKNPETVEPAPHSSPITTATAWRPSSSLPPSRYAMASASAPLPVERSALTPRTDAQVNHVVTAENSSTHRKEDNVSNLGADSRLRIEGPPRPRGSADGSLSDLARRNRSLDEPARPPTNKTKKTRAASPNYFPRNPKDTQATASPRRPTPRLAAPMPPSPPFREGGSIQSQVSGRSSAGPPAQQQDWNWIHRSDPEAQEQALFEQRLCEDAYGVAVRKINQNGKSNLRYVKCVPLDDKTTDGEDHHSTTKSVSSLWSLSRRERQRDRSVESTDARGTVDNESHRSLISTSMNNRKKALTWGKKKDFRLSLDRFVAVRKGKTTERTRKNAQPASRLLSLITDDKVHTSLDIEAPTRLDRDKFARAFAKFLGVPLEMDAEGPKELLQSAATVDINSSASMAGRKQHAGKPPRISAAHSAPDMEPTSKRTGSERTGTTVVMAGGSSGVVEHLEIQFDGFPAVNPATQGREAIAANTSLLQMASQSAAIIAASADEPQPQLASSSLPSSSQNLLSTGLDTSQQPLSSAAAFNMDEKQHDADDGTVVSSLTGAGFDQEIVEELHQALTDLRAELEASRAEAARAVKVAEQAIQSAENNSSKDWNSTVTHKAAEAAALAQKKSAEAIAKQRLAEERLAGERRTAAFWRRQAEAAEEEAGVLQTRAAAAEVQRAVMAEELEAERRKANTVAVSLKHRFASSEIHQREALEAAMERGRSLEIELDGTRRDLLLKNEETKVLHDTLVEVSSSVDGKNNGTFVRKKLGRIGRKKKTEGTEKLLLASHAESSCSSIADIKESGSMEQLSSEQVLKLHAETAAVRRQFELLRRATADELNSLPVSAQLWANQASQALVASQSEISRLRTKLAVESSTRRKLLHEVQDLRGNIRVYCRQRAFDAPSSPKSVSNIASSGILSMSSQETILLNRDRLSSIQDSAPMSFEFDRIFHPVLQQKEIYSELEELILGVLDGYNVCIMAYGQTGSGKTHTILGDVRYYSEDGEDEPETRVVIENEGIQLQGVKQLFSVAEHRNARYQDVFSLTIVEVHDERLCDLVAGTDIAKTAGQVEFDDSLSTGRKSVSRTNRRRINSDEGSTFSQPANSTSSRGKQTKLEIRTNHDGDTVVQGLVSIPVTCFDDVLRVWHECLAQRAHRLADQGLDTAEYEASSHVIATVKVVSTNIATGIGSVGKIQFVDLAGADLEPRRPPSGPKTKNSASDGLFAGVGNNNEWKFANKSLATLSDVVNARCQFTRSVPYRNSTLTHLLSDSLEADTKVLMLVCVSSDPKDVQETVCALRFASRMRRVNIGKATKHSLSHS